MLVCSPNRGAATIMKKEEKMEAIYECVICKEESKESKMALYVMPDGEELWHCNVDYCTSSFAVDVIGG